MRGGDSMLDPCNYSFAFWNGPAIMAELKTIPLLYQLTPAIGAIAVIASFYSIGWLLGRKQ